METGLWTIGAGIHYLGVLRIEAIGFPTFGILPYPYLMIPPKRGGYGMSQPSGPLFRGFLGSLGFGFEDSRLGAWLEV